MLKIMKQQLLFAVSRFKLKTSEVYVLPIFTLLPYMQLIAMLLETLMFFKKYYSDYIKLAFCYA